MKTESKPTASARPEKSSNSFGPNCSADALYPSLIMRYPIRRREDSNTALRDEPGLMQAAAHIGRARARSRRGRGPAPPEARGLFPPPENRQVWRRQAAAETR